MESIKSLRGIGTKRAKQFEKKGINTIEDLLYYFPRGHEDRTNFSEISDCLVGEFACIKVKVFSPVHEVRIRKNFTIYSMTVFDDSGAMNVVWYNNRFVKNAFRTDDEVLFYGKIVATGRKKEMQNPVFEKAGSERFIGRIVPVYPLSESLTQKTVASAVEQALVQIGTLNEYIPTDIRNRYNVAEINFAIRNIHFPSDLKSYEIARRRFVFEELFTLQFALFGRRADNEKVTGKPFGDIKCVEKFIKGLPFELTGAQRRAVDTLCDDLKSPVPMSRLLQGDVGSGKTVVAACCMYAAHQNGFQSAIMTPTEILASQHYETFSHFFCGTGIKCVLLTSGSKNKKDIYEKIFSGEYDVVIGTNAIIQEGLVYHNLGFVVADEQHRFGVAQRAKLSAKGENPNTLIMTATPIPRTLSLILYGDLDISVIDELPPGRKPVATYAVGENMRKRVCAFLEKHVLGGSQAYVVCPLIEENEQNDLANAEDIYKRLKAMFPQFTVGLIHGKMKSAEKENIMYDFAANKIQILVSTTVIEVGVNVPNSNIMIIENAERFGLSTLHQLRGRVGRGQDKAFCIMIAHGSSEITKQRMHTLCTSNDGFYISEQDLKLRGPGDFFGTRQHGLPQLKTANLFTDTDVLEDARRAAEDIAEGRCKISAEEFFALTKKADKMLSDSIIFN